MKASNHRFLRRRLLTRAAVGIGVIAGGAAGFAAAAQPGTKPKKYSKEKVGYRDQPYQERSCAKCMLYAGNGECAIVEGEVSVDGWCVQWTPATMGGFNRLGSA